MPDLDAACAGCRAPLREGALFCTHCGGTALTAPAPRTAAVMAPPVGNEIQSVAILFGACLAVVLVMAIAEALSRKSWVTFAGEGLLIAVQIATIVLRWADVRPLLRAPTVNWRDAGLIAGAVLGCAALVIGYFDLLGYIGVPSARMIKSYLEAGLPVAAIYALVSRLPATLEECLFRGVIQGAMTRVFDNRDALIIQAALFSVLHLSPAIFISHFLMGLCFGYVRLRSGSLYPGMVLHAAWNAAWVYAELLQA